ncbi:MAG: hypothetical protein K0S09_3249 [Sphingobacteriaceae bacterium]|nr:hypothetical protein [Sphingobacteriaceae bacterium]
MESLTELTGTLKESLLQDNENANVEQSERILSLAAGSFVFIKGIGNLFSHPTLALGELIVGGMLVHRGVTGHCAVKQMAEGTPMQAPDAIFISTTEYSTDLGSDASSGSMNSGNSSSGMGSGSSSSGMGSGNSSSAGSFGTDMGSGSSGMGNNSGSSSGI